MRLTLRVTNAAGVRASLRQYSVAARGRAAVAMRDSGEATFNLAAALCAFRTGFMLSKLTIVFSDSGLAYSIGWLARDFIRQVNPVTGQVILVFYPRFVVLGTRRMAAQDNLTPAMEATRAQTLAALARALAPQPGD